MTEPSVSIPNATNSSYLPSSLSSSSSSSSPLTQFVHQFAHVSAPRLFGSHTHSFLSSSNPMFGGNSSIGDSQNYASVFAKLVTPLHSVASVHISSSGPVCGPQSSSSLSPDSFLTTNEPNSRPISSIIVPVRLIPIVSNDGEGVVASSSNVTEQEKSNSADSRAAKRRRTRPVKGKWKHRWTCEDDQRLREAVMLYQDAPVTWKFVAELVGNEKTANSCYQRWNRTLGVAIRKGPFRATELFALARAVAAEGESWSRVALHIPGRTDTQCRMQWNNIKNGRLKTDVAGLLHRIGSAEAGDPVVASAVRQVEEWVAEDPDRVFVEVTKSYDLPADSLRLPDRPVVAQAVANELSRRVWPVSAGRRGLRHRVRGTDELSVSSPVSLVRPVLPSADRVDAPQLPPFAPQLSSRFISRPLAASILPPSASASSSSSFGVHNLLPSFSPPLQSSQFSNPLYDRTLALPRNHPTSGFSQSNAQSSQSQSSDRSIPPFSENILVGESIVETELDDDDRDDDEGVDGNGNQISIEDTNSEETHGLPIDEMHIPMDDEDVRLPLQDHP